MCGRTKKLHCMSNSSLQCLILGNTSPPFVVSLTCCVLVLDVVEVLLSWEGKMQIGEG